MRKLFLLLLIVASCAHARTLIDMRTYGIKPDVTTDMAPRIASALQKIKRQYASEPVTLQFAPGHYNLHAAKATKAELYISNHDQTNPKTVGLLIEEWDSLTIEAPGVEFLFHGRMIPLVVRHSRGVSFNGFSIDFDKPQITQVEVVKCDPQEGITFRAEPWSDVFVNKKGGFSARGEEWENSPRTGIAFDGQTRHVLYRTADISCPLDSVIELGHREFRAPKWRDSRLQPGTRVALRAWGRPTPGIVLDECVNPTLTDVSVRYAEGMGLVAQLCDSVTLRGFNVCLRGDDDPRYFTTQADATHFSGCKGKITSVNGLYEGMMDDAINVHGTYLKVTARPDSHTIHARYMHRQTYGFKWGEPGDTVQIISAPAMEPLPNQMVIESIRAVDSPVKEWEIRFTRELPELADGPYGLENMAWTPEVHFAGNTVRNNRARGALFSTPRPVVVEENLFDHTSGTAILLCGDCMGWYETGACRAVMIRNNRFINALTSTYQFTEAVISIYPEIHRLDLQKGYFHSNIAIEGNEFQAFDAPLLYAKSVDGLKFTGNRLIPTANFKPYHPNRYTFKLERAANVEISGNDFGGINPSEKIY